VAEAFAPCTQLQTAFVTLTSYSCSYVLTMLAFFKQGVLDDLEHGQGLPVATHGGHCTGCGVSQACPSLEACSPPGLQRPFL